MGFLLMLWTLQNQPGQAGVPGGRDWGMRQVGRQTGGADPTNIWTKEHKPRERQGPGCQEAQGQEQGGGGRVHHGQGPEARLCGLRAVR